MKTVKTISLKMPNGDIILAVSGNGTNREFFVNTSNGIITYTVDEVNEVYGLVPANTNMVGIEV